MPQLKLKEHRKMIKKLDKEFTVEKTLGKDINVKVYYKGAFVFWTKYSKGDGEIPPPVVRKIIKQFHFKNGSELYDWKSCLLCCKKYVKLLEERSVI